MAPANEAVAGGGHRDPLRQLGTPAPIARGGALNPGVAGQRPLANDESLVDLRCSVAIVHSASVLLLRRDSRDDWVLPGGRPSHGESMAACARREACEETGLDVHPTRCAFVLEVIDPDIERRIVELVFQGSARDPRADLVGEPGVTPQWIAFSELRGVSLRPPIAGYLPALGHGDRDTAPYLGNTWRPDQTSSWLSDPNT